VPPRTGNPGCARHVRRRADRAFAFGLPPKARVFGNGTLASASKLGEANFASALLGLLYVPRVEGTLRGHIAGGVNCMFDLVTPTTGLLCLPLM
jgi:hypothetical protein